MISEGRQKKMLLHQIRPNYHNLSPTERMESIHTYRAKRLAELETPIPVKVIVGVPATV